MKKAISKNIIVLLFIMFLAAIGIVGGSFYFIRDTTLDINKWNQEFLSEITMQHASMMKKTVQHHLDNVSAIANVIGNERIFSLSSAMKILSSENKRASFKRMGYADVNGLAATTDGETFQMNHRAYFQKALKGERSVVIDSLITSIKRISMCMQCPYTIKIESLALSLQSIVIRILWKCYGRKRFMEKVYHT